MEQQYYTKDDAGELVPVSRGEFAELALAGAERTLELVRVHVENEFWADACFLSQTAAGQALEAYLISVGEGRKDLESVGAMAQLCAQFQPDFAKVARAGKYLDRYYATTRSLDAMPNGANPFQWFDAEDAQDALEHAAEIVAFTRNRLLADVYETTQ